MMRAGHILAFAAALVLFGCAQTEAPLPVPPPLPQFMPAPLLPPVYNPPLPGPRAGPSLRYAKAKQHCQIKTRITVNKAGVKRTAKYRVCLK